MLNHLFRKGNANVKLVSLSLQRYRQFLEPTVLQIPAGLTGICGANGVGKSKLIEAIGYVLYGPNRQILPKGDRAAHIAARALPGCQPRVELILELRGQLYQIVRSPGETYLRLHGTTDYLAETPTGVSAKVCELLQLSPVAYLNTFVARQNEIAALQMLSATDRQRVVNRMIGITVIETAVNLAQDHSRVKESRRKVEQEHLTTTSTQANAQLHTAQTALNDAKAALLTFVAERDSIEHGRKNTIDELIRLQQQAAQVESLSRELAASKLHLETLETTYQNQSDHMTRITTAREELSTVESVIESLRYVPQSLEEQILLKELTSLRQRLLELERELADRILPGIQKRNEIQAKKQAKDEALQKLRESRAEFTRLRSLAEQAQSQAVMTLARYSKLRDTANLLGPDGICENCGQKFGTNLAQALSHYTEEISTTEASISKACADIEYFTFELADLQNTLTRTQAEYDEFASELETLRLFPGEEARITQDLAAINDQLASIPSGLQGRIYDPALHHELEQKDSETQRDRETAKDLRFLVSQDTEIQTAIIQTMDACATIVGKCSELETQLAELTLEPAALITAEARVKAANDAWDAANKRAQAAAEDVARLGERMESARAILGEVVAQEERLQLAERDVWVAQHTEKLLGQLLRDVTADARPRITDLMDGWSRTLLGSRFRGIELTSDYRIRCDTGGSWHYIEHFSGGEQTLLALMLRVGISIFCRERAGFDTGFLILDEIFGNQDGSHRVELVRFLGEIQEHYHQILVINHIDDVTDMLDSIIDVKSSGLHSSTAILRL